LPVQAEYILVVRRGKQGENVLSDNRIREIRIKNDVTAAQLARMLDVSGARLRRWDRQEVRPPREIVQMIATRFNVSADYVAGDDVPAEPSHLAMPSANETMPLYGRAAAGNGAVTVSGGPVDYIEKPSYLSGIDDCYAVMIVGESMEPRFFPGEIVIVHPYRPVRTNDYCIVQYTSDDEICAIAKRYIAQDKEGLKLLQHNPEKIINIAAADIISIHYIKAIRSI